MCKSDSSQSLKTLSLVGKPTAITKHSTFWDNSCFKTYQSKRLLWRWAFRHSDAQPGHHETRWRRSHFSPPFPESFRKLNGSMLFWTLRCFVVQCPSLCLQCRLLPCIFIFSDVFMVFLSQEAWKLRQFETNTARGTLLQGNLNPNTALLNPVIATSAVAQDGTTVVQLRVT